MNRGVGQQIIIGVVVLLVVVATLVIGFLLAQSDSTVRLSEQTGDVNFPTPTLLPTPTYTPDAGATLTPTSAILEPGSPTATSQLVTDTPEGPTATTPPTNTPVASCGPPANWVTYTVQSGENLFRIGLRYGQSVAQMMQANCLESDRVQAGQVLHVPPGVVNTPAPTSAPPDSAPPPDNNGPVAGCPDLDAQITSPASGSTVYDDIFFFGLAYAGEFQFYKLEIRSASGTDDDFITFDGAENPIETNDFLGQVGAYAFPPGQYIIRLAVVDIHATIVGECRINLTLQGGTTQ